MPFNNAASGWDVWEGQSVNHNQIIVKFTYLGDANLDGQITGDDYGVLDGNVGKLAVQTVSSRATFAAESASSPPAVRYVATLGRATPAMVV